MFSRAAKSIVKSIGQRRYHAGEENAKMAMAGGEIGRSLSQMLKQTSKLDVLALYDVAASNKTFSSIPPRFHSFSNGEPLNTNNSRMLTMLEKSRFGKDGQQTEALQEPVRCFSTRVSNIPQNETEELVEALRHLPIAEECAVDHAAKTNKIVSQGDNEPRGPRVLGEMGPAKFLHGGRIVSEIYRQLPNLASYLRKDCSRSVSDASRRQLSSFATFSAESSLARDGTYAEKCPKSCSRNANDIPSVSRTWTVEKMCKRSQSRKKEARKLIAAPSEQTVEKKHLIEMDDLAMRMEKLEKKKARSKRPKEPRTSELVPVRFEKQTSSERKSRNWTIPAAISDKKPRTLYGSVHQRHTSITWFFSKLLDGQNSDGADGYRDSRYKNYKIGKLGCIQNQKVIKEVNENDDPREKSPPGDRLNASTSMSDLAPERLEVPTQRMLNGGSRSPERFQVEKSSSVHQSLQEPVATDEKVLAASSIDDSDCDTISNIEEPQKPVRKMSSQIAQFLENLMLRRQRSWSLSTLASYNLDSLFVQEPAPVFNYGALTPVLFSCKTGGSKSTLKDKLCSKFCPKKGKKDNDICKKGQKGSKGSCGDGDHDPCKNVRAEKTYGSSCKKSEPEKKCGKEDPCKKQKDEATQRKSCRKDGEKLEDPCKKLRKGDVHGKQCKHCGAAHFKQDPCDKFWRDDVHGARCKQSKEKKKQPDWQCPTPAKVEKKPAAARCKEQRPKCDPPKKPAKSCEKTCHKEKKEDRCKETMPKCGTPKKTAKSCDRTCPKEKKQPSCKVEDKCGTPKKTAKSCDKTCHKEKKQPSCKVEDKCGTPKKTAKSCDRTCHKEKKQPSCKVDTGDKCGTPKKVEKKKSDKNDCPPVTRAPGCSEDGGKSGGCGKGPSCRGFATVASRTHL